MTSRLLDSFRTSGSCGVPPHLISETAQTTIVKGKPALRESPTQISPEKLPDSSGLNGVCAHQLPSVEKTYGTSRILLAAIQVIKFSCACSRPRKVAFPEMVVLCCTSCPGLLSWISKDQVEAFIERQISAKTRSCSPSLRLLSGCAGSLAA